MSLKEKVHFALSTLAPMRDYTFPFLCQVIGRRDGGPTEPVGSGLRCHVQGRPAVVTAAHVVDPANSKFVEWGVSLVAGGHPLILRPANLVRRRDLDLAVYFLPEERDESDRAFWPEDRIDSTLDRLATDYLFVHGFPKVRSQVRSMPGDARASSQSLPYGAMQRIDGLIDSIEPFQFAIEFDVNGVSPAVNPRDQRLFEEDAGPALLSGSPVWRIGASGEKASEWSPERCQLVGIVTHWRPLDRVLLATRADRLMEFARSVATTPRSDR